MKPAVSVVIASKNYGHYLGGALRSVLRQSWTDFEVILVDDGSTDDTPIVVRPYLSDPRVHYHRTDGLGQPRAKNLGIMHARADLVAFLDGDDEWLPTKLERQLPLFDNPATGVVYSRRELMNGDGIAITEPPREFYRGQVYDQMLVQNSVCFSSVIVRRSVFESVGLFDPKLPLAIDYDLWLRVARHFEFDFVDEPLIRYRTGHANLSSRIAERIVIILSVLKRSLWQRGNAATADPIAQGDAVGSTMRTMAWVARKHGAIESAKWYLRAARHDGRWLASARGICGALCRRT